MIEERNETEGAHLPDWLNMHQALAWARYRSVEFAVGAHPDTLMAQLLWPKMEALAGRLELASALREKRLVAEGAREGGEWETIPSAQWHRLDVAPRDACRHEPYELIRVACAALLTVFPPMAVARASHAANVAWCERWIKDGRGNGMDKTWPSFASELEHKGTSRENFREAWNEAKGKKPR